MTLSTGQVVQRRYRIVRLLGQGGFGAVYRAWDIQMQGPCALKQNLVTSTEAGDQFSREARMLFGLRHPSLPRVIDYFIEPGLGEFLVMDFIDGQDLKSMIEERGQPQPADQVVDWISQVCEALSYLNSQTPPIIHRDIKPANIRITKSLIYANGLAVLVDFGIAKTFDPQSKTTKGARVVSPGSPPLEQYGLGITDHQSDIYSLGATAYYLLTGAQPPSSLNISMGSVAPPAPVHLSNPAIPLAVSLAIESAMHVDRQDRTKSADEFRHALDAARGKMPAPQPSSQPSRAATPAPPAIAPAQVQPLVHPPEQAPRSGPPPIRKDPSAQSLQPRPSKPPQSPPQRKAKPPHQRASSQLAGLPKWFPWLFGCALVGILITVIGLIIIGAYF